MQQQIVHGVIVKERKKEKNNIQCDFIESSIEVFGGHKNNHHLKLHSLTHT